MWTKHTIETTRGHFELFQKGSGPPICITHLYSAFDTRGTYFAEPFCTHFQVFLVNVREAGESCTAENDEALSMRETVKDLEAVREALGFAAWAFAGHSTGGMLGLVYALISSESLTKLLINGTAASNAYMEHEGSMYCARNPVNREVRAYLFKNIK